MSTTPLPKQFRTVHGRRMAYVEAGTGDPIVFLHGNPTSSYLWRNVIPHVERPGALHRARPDRHGRLRQARRSGPGRYRFVEHRAYLDALLDAPRPGRRASPSSSTTGARRWASTGPTGIATRVAGIAYMEAIVMPVTWDDWPERRAPVFQALPLPRGRGDDPRARTSSSSGSCRAPIMRELTEEEMADYRRPFTRARRGPPAHAHLAPRDPDRRRARRRRRRSSPPTATGSPPATCPSSSSNAEPGAILTGAPREFCRTWPNQTEITVKRHPLRPGGLARTRSAERSRTGSPPAEAARPPKRAGPGIRCRDGRSRRSVRRVSLPRRDPVARRRRSVADHRRVVGLLGRQRLHGAVGAAGQTRQARFRADDRPPRRGLRAAPRRRPRTRRRSPRVRGGRAVPALRRVRASERAGRGGPGAAAGAPRPDRRACGRRPDHARDVDRCPSRTRAPAPSRVGLPTGPDPRPDRDRDAGAGGRGESRRGARQPAPGRRARRAGPRTGRPRRTAAPERARAGALHGGARGRASGGRTIHRATDPPRDPQRLTRRSTGRPRSRSSRPKEPTRSSTGRIPRRCTPSSTRS